MDTQHLWDTYASQLRAYISARIQGPAVDDILQQVFLKAHKKQSTIQDPTAVKAWLYRITQHSIIDRYRKEHGGKQGSVDAGFWESVEDNHESDRSIIAKNISSCILPMIEDLDKTERDIMHQYLDGIPYASIAHQTGKTVANIKVIIHRTKKKLQQKYTQCCYQYRDDQGVLIDTRCSSNCGCDNSVLRP